MHFYHCFLFATLLSAGCWNVFPMDGMSGTPLQTPQVVLIQPGLLVPTERLASGGVPLPNDPSAVSLSIRPSEIPSSLPPTRASPFVLTFPIVPPGKLVGEILQDFHTRLTRILTGPPRSTVLAPPFTFRRDDHVRFLEEQLRRSYLQPMVYLGKTLDQLSEVFAFPIEPTPAMNSVFQTWEPRYLQWAILCIFYEKPDVIQHILYAQIDGPDLNFVRSALGSQMGAWGTTLKDALERLRNGPTIE